MSLLKENKMSVQDKILLDELKEALDDGAVREGLNETFLEEVTLFRVSEHKPKCPLIYEQCFCIAVHGHKHCHLSDATYTYGEDEFLVVPAIVPLDIEVVPEGDNPLLSITVPLDFEVIQELVESINKHDKQALGKIPSSPGIYFEPLTNDVIEPTIRLLKILKSRKEANIFGKQIIREIYYRILMGKHGHLLASAAFGESDYALIAKSLRFIHDNYDRGVDIDHLAEGANMSVRSFYNHFKAVTALTPVQYLKRIRLEKARQFMIVQGEQASSAAHLVGYESPSQFSREFKRHFGYTPREAVRNSQGMPG